jgi:hypothetical protein
MMSLQIAHEVNSDLCDLCWTSSITTCTQCLTNFCEFHINHHKHNIDIKDHDRIRLYQVTYDIVLDWDYSHLFAKYFEPFEVAKTNGPIKSVSVDLEREE